MQKRFLSLFDFFLFTSLYISLCAVLMAFQSTRLLLHTAPSLELTAFVFFSTVCSYNFHWFLTPASLNSPSVRSNWSARHRTLELVLYFAGLAGSAFCFFLLRSHWLALAFAGFVTFLYSAPKLPQTLFRHLRDIAIGKTVFLAFVWTYVTAVLPVLLSNAPWQVGYTLFTCSRFFLIYAICIIFDYRDRDDDRKQGIRSMITYFSETGINQLFIASMVLFAVSTAALYWCDFQMAVVAALLVPGIITAALYRYSKTNFSDYLYYFVLDGLMMFSGLLLLIFRI